MAYAPTSNSLNADGGRISSSKRITITLSHSTYEALVELVQPKRGRSATWCRASWPGPWQNELSRNRPRGITPSKPRTCTAQVLPWGSRAIAAHACTNRHSFSWYVNRDRWVRLNALGQRYWQSPH